MNISKEEYKDSGFFHQFVKDIYSGKALEFTFESLPDYRVKVIRGKINIYFQREILASFSLNLFSSCLFELENAISCLMP